MFAEYVEAEKCVRRISDLSLTICGLFFYHLDNSKVVDVIHDLLTACGSNCPTSALVYQQNSTVYDSQSQTPLFIQSQTTLSAQLGCGDAPVVQHSTADKSNATGNSVVEFHCHTGYTFSNGLATMTSVCDRGQWSPFESECQGT